MASTGICQAGYDLNSVFFITLVYSATLKWNHQGMHLSSNTLLRLGYFEILSGTTGDGVVTLKISS